MLDKLSQEQTRLMDVVRDEWINFFLYSGKDISVQEARPHVDWLYEKCGLPPPEIMVNDSPTAFLKSAYKHHVPTVRQVWGQGGRQVWGQVWEQVWGQVERQVDGQVWEQVGEHSALSFYNYFERIGVVNSDDFRAYRDFIKSGVWNYITFDNAILICKLPTRVLKDNNDRLHSVQEAAVQWRDHNDDYFIHGVGFDKDLWQRARGMDARQILQLDNIEQRFAVLEDFGAERLLSELEAKLIDSSERGNELFRIYGVIPDTPIMMLRYTDPSTRKVYVSFVPPDTTKADEGMAWKFKLMPEEYKGLKNEA